MYRLRTTGIAIGIAIATLPVDAAETVRTITLRGEAKVAATPDMATVSTGVVTQAPYAADALKKNTAAMQQVLGVLKKSGIAKKDLQTSHFQVSPVYRRGPMGYSQEVIAYRVSNMLRVRVRKLAELGKTLDALVRAGGNRISGIAFSVADPSELIDKARFDAVKNARKRAEIYARAAGVQVGRVQQINEQAPRIPQPYRLDSKFTTREAAAVPIEPGELMFHVSVNIVFELKASTESPKREEVSTKALDQLPR